MSERPPSDHASVPPRREFLQQIGRTGLAVAGAAAAAFWLHDRESPAHEDRAVVLPSFRVEASAGAGRMAVIHGTSIEAMVKAAASELGGMERFVRSGDVVLIKPNVAFDRGPLLGATTHPDVVGAIVRLCRSAGASKVIVADNPINSPEAAFARTGIARAAAEAGALVRYPRPDAFRDVAMDGVVLRRWPLFAGAFADVTRVIGVAPAKDHNLCGASLTIKNWYGLLGGGRNRLHQRIHDAIADLACLVRPTLVFLDATRLLMTNGPTGGSLSDVAAGDTIVCGVDPVAVDAYGAMRLGRDLDVVRYLALAEARGAGTRTWRSLAWREVTV